MKKIKAVFFDVREFEKDYIEKHTPEYLDLTLLPQCLDEHSIESLLDEIKDVEILSIFSTSKLPSEFISKFPDLKLIIARTTGYDHIAIDYCKENNILVTNAPNYGEATVAEFAIGLLLNVSRKINHAYNSLQKGIINVHGFMGNDLCDKTIGVIGTGAIGSHFIKIARGFGMNVLAYDPFPKIDLTTKYDVNYVELENLYKESDIISLHCPGTKENYHMISHKQFELMKNGVIIINTARGEIIDTEALYKALMDGKVKGAGLDVLECEDILVKESKYLLKIDCIKKDCLVNTLLNHKLLALDNVIVTPHVAYDTIEAVNRILETTYCNIDKYYNGEDIKNVY